jgi:hypothetical protein
MHRKDYEDVLFHKILPTLAKQPSFISNIQLSSFNYFLEHRLQKIIDEDHFLIVPLDKHNSVRVRFGQVYVDFPYIIDNKRDIKYITPHEARVRELTYSSVVSVDLQFESYKDDQRLETTHYSKVFIARIPMMIRSQKCNLSRRDDDEECKYDPGGYFIIKGKERVLISQERGNLNQVYVFKYKNPTKYSYYAELRAMSEENGHSVLIQMKLCPELYKILLGTSFFQQDVDVVYILKYFECTSDDVHQFFQSLCQNHSTIKMIIQTIMNLLSTISVETASQHLCESLVHSMMKDAKEQYLDQIMTNDIFLNLGISSSKYQKKMVLLLMIKKLLMTAVQLRTEDDRDHVANKRFESAGYLVSELFRSLYKRSLRLIEQQLQKKQDILVAISRINIISQGIKSCFSTGNWGIPKSNYIRCGVSQILSRLSYNSTLSHLRRILIPIGKEGKNSKIRQIHCSQFGFICANECFDPMTQILMWDGSIKFAKDIVVGDFLIDDDGKPTRVHKTVSGIDQMYEIQPAKKNFMSHTVTSNHILTLKVRLHKSLRKNRDNYTLQYFDFNEKRFIYKYFKNKDDALCFMNEIPDNDIMDISIEDYDKLPEALKKDLVLFKCNGIQWKKRDVELDPYILGMWLGDGNSDGSGFSTEDQELLTYWKNWAIANGMIINTYKEDQISDPTIYTIQNGFRAILQKYNLIHNKHIPKEYLVNDRETRLKVLAGLIDTDGSVRANGREIRISHGSANTRILEDTLLLAQSLGFSCHLNTGKNTELTITGECIHEIPTLLSRKKLNDYCYSEKSKNKCKSYLQSLFKIVKKEIGQFVGWQLDGNGRFLLSDATVSHNTPEGSSAGIVKSFSLFATVSNKVDACWIRNVLEDHFQDVFTVSLSSTGNEQDPNMFHIFLNGVWIGTTRNASAFVALFHRFRQLQIIPYSVSISLCDIEKSITLYSDDGRILRPLWNLRDFNKNTIEEYLQKDVTWEELCSNRMIEYVDANELDNAYIGMYLDECTLQHTHCEIHPSFIFGVCVNLIPYVDHIQAPRITYQSAMSKQAIGIYCSNAEYRCDTVTHVLCHPEKPVVQTHLSELLHYDKMASGSNVIVAVACYGGLTLVEPLL